MTGFSLYKVNGEFLGKKERRLYTYAYGLLLNKIAIYAIIAIVGTITGNWIGMFSFLLPFTILRQYAGGIHLEKPMNCIIFSGFLVFGCGQYLAVASDIGKILCALWVAAILLIFVLAPIDTKGKKLDKTAKKDLWKTCKRSIGYRSYDCNLLLGMWLYSGNQRYSNSSYYFNG